MDGVVASDGRDAPADLGHDAPVVDTGVDLGVRDMGVDTGTLSKGLVGYWKLDSTGASTVMDSSGLGNNGFQVGIPTLITTSLPQLQFADPGAFAFTNNQDAVSVPDNPNGSLRPTTELTVALWVKITNLGGRGRCGSAPTGEQYLFHRRTTSTTDNMFEALALIKTPNSGFGFIVNDNAGHRTEIDAWPNGATSIATGIWYHVAGTFSSLGTQARIYVNGVPLNSATRTAPVVYDSTRPVFLARSGECGGTGEGNWDFGLAGDLDDVRFYDRALGSDEVASLAAGND